MARDFTGIRLYTFTITRQTYTSDIRISDNPRHVNIRARKMMEYDPSITKIQFKAMSGKSKTTTVLRETDGKIVSWR